ncbi:CPL NUC119 domain containing protein [Nitzschia inconspicua]|uniref:CPL NUC119 domain containing protein n=1 Tax=Nitzschia inconspicua TaxID=303405 RepID=A0A9K3LG37_9STRA|nr:CPL NUC119 domain containing protein [Nitzschia inconspicua]
MAIKQHKRKSNGSDVGISSKKHKTATSNNNKDLSSSAQKRQVRKERQSHRRHADIVAEAKILWNKLRVKTNTPDDTTALMEQVMSLIHGKVAEIALQHDASRVIQAAIQFGSTDQRRELLTELCASQDGSLAELAKIQYAHFCCLKLIKYCNRDDECIKMIIKSFQGEIPKLAVHGVASRVVESLFLNLPPKTTAQLKQEFYGPHFSLFVRDIKGVPTLESNLKVATTDTQKQAALDFVKGIINKGMTKSFYGYTFFQQIFAEYMDVADPSDIRSMASTVADHSIHLLSTRAGTRVVAACASYGTPKDRKRICKSLKGYTTSSLLHRDAYLALLRLIQVTDDTVSIQKSILNEILTAPQSKKEGEGGNENTNQGNVLLDLALSETGSKLFLMLIVQDQSARLKYFDPYERTILEPVAMIKENGKDTPTSKKDPEARRKELLTYLEDALLNLCVENVEELLFSVPGSRILKEVYAHSKSEKLAKSVAKACHKAMLLYKENPQNEEKLASLFDDVVAHRAVKNLVLHDAENDVDVFTMALISLPENAFLDLMSTNRGAFVLSAMFKVSAARPALGKLRDPKVKKKLKSIYDRAEAKAGYEALMEALED